MRNASSPVRIPNRGFTLVELLLAMALTLTLMTMLYTAMDLHYRFSTMGQIEVERSQIARSLLSQMAADIRSTVYRPEEVPEEEETQRPRKKQQPSNQRSSTQIPISRSPAEASACLATANRSSFTSTGLGARPLVLRLAWQRRSATCRPFRTFWLAVQVPWLQLMAT